MRAPLPVPAPGFVKVTGKRKPPASMGESLYVQIRAGYVSEEAWPVKTTRWVWDWNEDGTANEHHGDVVAVRGE